MVAGVGMNGRWFGVAVIVAAGMLTGNSATALTLGYDVIDGTAGIFSPGGSGVFVVSRDLDGSIELETPGALEIGAVLEYTAFEMAGTGRLCESCDELTIEIALNESLLSTLEVVAGSGPTGLASDGDLFTIWTLTGDGWTVDLEVEATTRFLTGRNDISSTFFSHNYQITNITALGHVPEGVDISSLDVFKFDSAAVVPEPGTLLLMAGGLLGLATWRPRRERSL